MRRLLQLCLFLSSVGTLDLGAQQTARDLALHVGVAPNTVRPGDRLIITFTVSNLGSRSLEGVRIDSIVPAGLESFLGGAADARCSNLLNNCYPGVRISWQIGTLGPGTHKTVLMPASVRNDSRKPNNGVIPVTATAHYQGGPNVEATGGFAVNAEAPLSLDIGTDRGTVAPGETMGVTVRFLNRSQSPISGIYVCVELPRWAVVSEASHGGEIADQSQRVKWRISTLAPGANGELRLSAHVLREIVSGEVIALAAVANTADPEPQQLAAAEAFSVVSQTRGLRLAIASSLSRVAAGEMFTYALTVINQSHNDITDVTIRSIVPDGIEAFLGSAVQATCSNALNNCYSGVGITWRVELLPAGQSRTVLLPFQAASSRGMPYRRLIPVTAVAAWSGGSTDRITASNIIDTSSPIAISLRVDHGTVQPGENLTYFISLMNQTSIAADNLIVRSRLPWGAQLYSLSAKGRSTPTGEIEWALGRIAPFETRELQLSVTVKDDFHGSELIRNYVSADYSHEDVHQAAHAEVVSVLADRPALRLVIVPSHSIVRPGELSTYAITVTNTGTTARSGVAIHSIIPNGIEPFLGFAAEALCRNVRNNCIARAGITWSIGSLGPGMSRTVFLPARPQNRKGSSKHAVIRLSATVVADATGGDRSSAEVIVNEQVPMICAIIADRGVATPEGRISYLVRLLSRSEKPIQEAVIQVVLPPKTRLLSADTEGLIASDERIVVWSVASIAPQAGIDRRFEIQIDTNLSDGQLVPVVAVAAGVEREALHVIQSRTTTVYGGTHGLRLGITPSIGQAAPGRSISFFLTVTNQTEADVAGVIIRAVVPDALESFLGSAAEAQCSNILNNCYPGVGIGWSVGSLRPGESRTVELPSRIRTNLSDASPNLVHFVAAVHGEQVNGDRLATSASIAEYK